MKRILVALAILVLPAQSHASFLTCNQAVDVILFGKEAERGVAVGHAAGATDVLAGLLCLTGSSRCGCLSNVVTSRTTEYSDALANELLGCGNDPAFGASMRAAQRVCR